MWLLARFRSDEIQVIEENNEFLSVQKYLEKELHDLESGESELIPPEELDSHLENVIKKYED
ncbi:MAG: tRNA pseudouridine synthase A [Thermotogota bacterium]